ncbi:MAG: hypothetical protein ABIP50_03655 [Candidatus Saccharimonadales bacterium]
MSSNTIPTKSTPQKYLGYWRKNYLFGIARPGALYFDGTNFTCYDNKLQSVFSAPLKSVTIKKGAGVFNVLIDGVQTSILTYRGGGISPTPSKQLLAFMEQSTSGAYKNDLPIIATGVSTLVSPVLGAAVDVVAIADYVKGQKTLGQFLQSIGLLPA